MTLSQKVLKFLHPRDEKQRMELRFILARAHAEVENLERTLVDCLKEPKKNGEDKDESQA